MFKVAILGARRTPIGAFMGELAGTRATALGSVAIAAALADSGLEPADLDEVIMGMVLPAGAGQAPTRQASLGAGLPYSVPATTVSKVCGSGMRAVIMANSQIASGEARTIVAGGMESMSNAPHLLAGSRRGTKYGQSVLLDHIQLDGLQDAYQPDQSMGNFAEKCARHFAFPREAQDAYAAASLSRAFHAAQDGAFDREIAEVSVPAKAGTVVMSADEQPRLADARRIPGLRPAFAADGTITAASSSSISDGAAALVLADRATVAERGLTPRAWIVGSASHAQEPDWFTTAPAAAAKKLLQRIGWSVSDVDLWEVNEAFAVVAMAFMEDVGTAHERVNVNGGACALGHPIGASGARILVTLLHALEQRGLKRGIAAICIGGGEALAVAIERP